MGTLARAVRAAQARGYRIVPGGSSYGGNGACCPVEAVHVAEGEPPGAMDLEGTAVVLGCDLWTVHGLIEGFDNTLFVREIPLLPDAERHGYRWGRRYRRVLVGEAGGVTPYEALALFMAGCAGGSLYEVAEAARKANPGNAAGAATFAMFCAVAAILLIWL